MSLAEFQRTMTYANSAHRSIVIATRLCRDALFDKVRPQTEQHPTDRCHLIGDTSMGRVICPCSPFPIQ
jgi:hypothetical protein